MTDPIRDIRESLSRLGEDLPPPVSEEPVAVVEPAWRERYPDADELTLRRLAGDR